MREAQALGADGWMADFGEWAMADALLASKEDALAVHNRYPVDWARMTHELLPQGLYFMRSAWIHSQPFTHVIWPGDQQTDWTDGDDVIIAGSVTNDEAKELFGTWQEPKPYIRIVPQPSS